MHRPQDIACVELAAAVARGERAALADALNLLDDRREVPRERAAALLSQLQRDYPQPKGHLIGITGPPGAGKSTLSAALIRVWRQRALRVAVLAVDPSSPISGGALLGDRLRMQTSAEDDGVFVRSLSNRGQFGGLSAEVWPMSQVMLAGFDIVLIETVGVGQREVDVSRMCDTTCYVAQPGSGDSIQFLKAGILEVPHILVVNKSDMGDVARRTLAELGSALTREHPDGGWQVPVIATSATTDSGIETLADIMAQHHRHLLTQQQLSTRRQSYQAHWILKRLQEEFGSFGIERLGGEQALLNKLRQPDSNSLSQYDALRHKLNAPATDTQK
ncbi:MAG: methylmalonyl Co-A mutase-associated GTPase MeaB [Halioglobus sp.]